MLRVTLITVIIFSYLNIFGQNLIKNPGFEDLEVRIIDPEFSTTATKAAHWFDDGFLRGNFFTSSYDNYRNENGVPSDVYTPFEGENYASIVTMGVFVTDGVFEVRGNEFFYQELDEPLKAGQIYDFSYRTLVRDIDGTGLCNSLSTTYFLPTLESYEVDGYASEISVSNDINNQLCFNNGWSEVSGCFIARGGERFVVFLLPTPDNIAEYTNINPALNGSYLFGAAYDNVVLEERQEVVEPSFQRQGNFCSNSFRLDAGTADATWFDADNNQIGNGQFIDVTITTTTTYTIQYDCGSRTLTVPFVDPSSNASFLPADTVICGQVNYTITLDFPVNWSDGTTGTSITIREAGTYSATYEEAGCILSDEIIVQAESVEFFSLGPDRILCPGETITIGSSLFSGQPIWNDGFVGGERRVSEVGQYILTKTDGSCTLIDTINVVPFDLVLDFLPTDTTVCEGSLVLSLDEIGDWSTGEETDRITVSEPGIYWAEIFEQGCTVRDSIEVFFEELPILDLGGDQILCGDDVITIGQQIEGVTHSWSDGDFPIVREVTTAGTYELTIEQNGCSITDAITITEGGEGASFLPMDTVICGTDPYTITLGQEASWSDGSSSTEFVISESGIYWAEVPEGGCTVRDSIEVTFEELPVLDLGGNQIICGDAITIGQQLEGVTHSWSDGDFPIVREITVAGTYELTIERNGCSITDAITITEGGEGASFLPMDTVICGTDPYTITLGQEAIWSDGSSSTEFTISESGTYWAEVSEGGCIVRDSIEVTFEELPVLDLGGNQIICGDAITIGQQIEGVTHSWSDGDFPIVREITAAGTYELTIERNGCSVTDAITITEGGEGASFLPMDTVICGTDPYTITLGQEAIWSDGSSSTEFTISESGTYWAEVSEGGCIVRDSIEVTFEELPVLDLGGNQIICSDAITIGQQLEGVTHSWSDGDFPIVREVTAAGTYELTIEQNGCSVTDAITITEGGEGTAFLPADTVICGTDPYIITLGQEAMWSDGSSSTEFTISESGTYWAEVSEGGCTVRDSIEVTFEELPVLDLGGNQIICGDAITIGQQIEGVTHSWSDGDFPIVREVTAAGTYELTIERNGCSVTDEVAIAEGRESVMFLPADTLICDGESLRIELAQEVVWSDGTSSTTFEITEEGVYWAEIQTGACSTRDSIMVNEIEQLEDELGSFEYCEGVEELTIVSPYTSGFEWWDGSTDIERINLPTGSYFLSYDVNQCTFIDSFDVAAVDCSPCSINLPNVITENATQDQNSYLEVFTKNCNLSSFSLKIFDRWGTQVYAVADLMVDWEGEFRDQNLQSGVYVLIVEYQEEGSFKKQQVSELSIIR